MADPVSLVGVVSASLHLAQKIHKYCGTFRDAPRHAAELNEEVVAIRHVLETLRTTLARQGPQSSVLLDRTSVLFFAVDGCQRRLKLICDALEPFTATSRVVRLWKRVQWPLERSETLEIVEALHRYLGILHFSATLDGVSILACPQQDALTKIESQLGSMGASLTHASAELSDVLKAMRELPTIPARLVEIDNNVKQILSGRFSPIRSWHLSGLTSDSIQTTSCINFSIRFHGSSIKIGTTTCNSRGWVVLVSGF